MMDNDKKLDPKSLLVGGIAGAVIDRFGIGYVLKKIHEYRERDREETAKRVAELVDKYRKGDG